MSKRKHRRPYLLFSALILGASLWGSYYQVSAEEKEIQSELIQVKTSSDTGNIPPASDNISQPEKQKANSNSSLLADQPGTLNTSTPIPAKPILDEKEKPETTSKEVNLIKNPSFEDSDTSNPEKWTNKEGAKDWKVYSDNQVSTDTTPKFERSENGQLKIESQTPFRGAVTQEVAINPQEKYDISFDIESQDKLGQAFIRIVEKTESPQKAETRLWLSAMTSGTSAKQTLSKIYNPKLNVTKVTLELYFETGTGKVIFDNIKMVAKGAKDSDQPRPVKNVLEESIELPLNKHYIFQLENYKYQVKDSQFASLEKGILVPKQAGTTSIRVTDSANNFIKDIPLTISAASEDKYRHLLDEWNEVTLGNKNYSPTNQHMTGLFKGLETSTASYLETLILTDNRQYLWEDLKDYKNSAQLTSTYRRLETIAKQISTPGSAIYQNEKAIWKVKNSLAWLNQNIYNANKDIDGKANWWDYEIGVPRALVGTLSLLHPYFSDSDIMTYTDAIEHFVPDPFYFRKTLVNPFPALGGNLVDMGRVKIISGLLRKDPTIIQKTVSSLGNLFKTVTKGEGFYEDGSYIDHTNVAYTGAYGNVLIDGLSQLLPIIQKTDYKIPNEQLELVYSWIEKAFLPLIIKGELMDMSRGRSISREAASSHAAAVELLRGLLRLATKTENPKNSDLKVSIKSLLKSDTFYNVYQNLNSYADIKAVDELLADNSIVTKNLTSYLSTFNGMDKLAYYNADKDFAFALSMHSSRTLNYEAMNDENTRGWYTGDGMFYLYNGDLAHYSNNYWPTVNPYKLAGTTEQDKLREDSTKAAMEKFTKDKKDAKKESGQVTGQSAFVGSTKLSDSFGLAAMDFSNWNQTLTTKKGWAILDDKIVFLGSDIQNKDQNSHVSTSIDQRKEDEKNPYTIYVNGKKLEVLVDTEKEVTETKTLFLESQDKKRNIAYLFFDPTTITLNRKHQTGSWYNINLTSTNKDTVSNSFINIEQKHDDSHNNYAYIMLPNIDKDTFTTLADKPELKLLDNSPNLQVVHDEKNKLWTVIKYDDQESSHLSRFKVTKAGLYIIQEKGQTYDMVYYDPITMSTQKSTDLALQN
ncbi:polysaccharide lyase 8 family protein [Streptococcus didelphis]|uniref:polysaccharide lyase 8 family protein n=1 Tax=Streptococcus didelphis TaxID=102886 RepID=UPI00036FA135|nr:polysaccharide lyase 8 family protein [Streptococcus didelphis]